MFRPEPTPSRGALAGLDLSGFDVFRADRRAFGGPFSGAASNKINASEAFFQDAVRAIRSNTLVIPNPLGEGEIATSDALVSPSTPWDTVPIFAFRYSHTETFYFLKRGLSWCTDLGLYFPKRRLLVSFQVDDSRIAQDCADLRHAFRYFSEHKDAVHGALLPDSPRSRPCAILTSGHFAHHIWNELSVVDGLVAETLHREVQFLVNRRPLGSLSALFPEIPRDLILDLAGPSDAALLHAMSGGMFVAPTGRRHIPHSVIQRVLNCATATFHQQATRADAFKSEHELILWITIRMDARTATNLVDVLSASITILLRRWPTMGVIFDGFTLSSEDTPSDWSQSLADSERRAIGAIVARVGVPFDHEVLCGRYTMEAFLWARTADFYICPYGTAQHKIAWINPVPGVVHAGENKREVALQDPAIYALQRGATPQFFYGRVARSDASAHDARRDLFSYELDVEAFAAFVDAAAGGIGARAPSASDA